MTKVHKYSRITIRVPCGACPCCVGGRNCCRRPRRIKGAVDYGSVTLDVGKTAALGPVVFEASAELLITDENFGEGILRHNVERRGDDDADGWDDAGRDPGAAEDD